MFCRQSCIMNEFNAVSGLNMYLCVVMYCFIVACDMCICVGSPFLGEEGRIRKDYRKEGVNLSPFFSYVVILCFLIWEISTFM